MSAAEKRCLNPECAGEATSRRKGWRLRSGEFADLCDRCASAYEEGRFCEMFHQKASGWRNCESCGKRVHCGCIVSMHMFAPLDTGGIDCMPCARENLLPIPSNGWPLPEFYHTSMTRSFKDPSGKNWNQLAGSGPVPWRQAPTLFNSSINPEMHPGMMHEVDRVNASVRLSANSMNKEINENSSERLINGNLKVGERDTLENGVAGTDCDEQSTVGINMARYSSATRDDPISPHFGMGVVYLNETNRISPSRMSLQSVASSSLTRQCPGNLHNGADSSADIQIRSARPQADTHGKGQSSKYCPRFTDEELQQISGNSNSAITPLFEKMLSASDAGRIGRLVVPKKCAEAHFPPISKPEGLPLTVQDAKGKEWIFQFRFWPNNNSRMYVLEGITPCIQNLQLQAGDIVTFSRLEPEGKLVMGYRKASGTPPAYQDNKIYKAVNVAMTTGNINSEEPSPWTKVDKLGYIAKDFESKPPAKKRKSSTIGSKSKRLRIDSDDLMELKLTWEEAQGLLRPPPHHVVSIVVIDGFEFEEYEDAPVLGKPTMFATDNTGHTIQFVQCENCCKWRKLPANALLPSKWICQNNLWDPERSSCSAAQELTTKQLEDLVPPRNSEVASKKKAPKSEVDSVDALEGLDTLANLAILGEGEAFSTFSQATTRHPRHRPGCSCIVCIQPPSGKGPKHKPSCICNVCQTVKRRFKTLKIKRQKKQSDKEAENEQNLQCQSEKLVDEEPLLSSHTKNRPPRKTVVVVECSDEDLNRSKSSTSPFKGQIDLNIQPEHEESSSSPDSNTGSVPKNPGDASESYLKPPELSGLDDNDNRILLAGMETSGTLHIGFGLGSGHNDSGDGNSTFPLRSMSCAPEAG